MERGLPFCATPSCRLHLYGDDARVRGVGNWAYFVDGLILGRTMVEGSMFCDSCARAKLAGREPEGVR